MIAEHSRDQGEFPRRRRSSMKVLGALIAIGVALIAGLHLVATAKANGGPIERLCDRYCDRVLDWAERKAKQAYDSIMRTPRRIDPVPVKGQGPECGTTPDGAQICCPARGRMQIEFRGWLNPYRNRNVPFVAVCVPAGGRPDLTAQTGARLRPSAQTCILIGRS